MITNIISLSAMFVVGVCYHIPRYVNPCGIVYSTGAFSHHGVRNAFHGMKPRISDLLYLLKASHHRSAKQLPEIYKSLMTFSYALDLVYRDNVRHEKSETCFFFIDTLPTIIDKHRELVCATDAAMAQLNMDIPEISIINLPNDWLEPQSASCVDKFFRYSETHTKYRAFLTNLLKMLHV